MMHSDDARVDGSLSGGTRPWLALLAAAAGGTALAWLYRLYRERGNEDASASVVERVSDYLEGVFPYHEASCEWDAARQVTVFRLVRHGRTMLLEIADEVPDEVEAAALVRRFREWELPARLRERNRILVTASGWEPLPWKQLSPSSRPNESGTVTDEALRESFPASDATSSSSIT